VIAGIALALAALTEVLRRRGEKRHSAEEKRHSAELRGLTDQLAAETARNEKSSRASEESSRAQSAAIEKLTRDNIELMHSLPLRPTPAPTGRRRVLGREHDIEALTATLLGDNPTVILWGERGIGKTQLAIALTKCDALRRRFGDNILWLKFGKSPSIDQQLDDCRYALRKKVSLEDLMLLDTFAERRDFVLNEIQRDLLDRNVLIVLDDVWRWADAEPFLIGGARCALLLTTPLKTMAEEAKTKNDAAVAYRVGALEDDARELLVDAAGEAATCFDDSALDDLCAGAGKVPMMLLWMGSYLRQQVAQLRLQDASPGTDGRLSSSDAERILRPLGTPEGRAGLGEGQIIQPLVDGLSDSVRHVLENVAVFRPKPNAFDLEEAGSVVEGADESAVDERLHALADLCLLEVSTDGAAENRSDAGTQGGTRPRYSVYNSVADYVVARLRQRDPDRLSHLHQLAADHFEAMVDPTRDGFPDELKAYRSMYEVESREWQRAASNWVYHLSNLADRSRAHRAFDRIYFELFWWWGSYLAYDFLPRLIRDWEATSPPDSDKGWLQAINQLQDSYTPVQRVGQFPSEPTWELVKWDEVQDALITIRKNDSLDGDNLQLQTHDTRHVRALTDIFLAQSYRYIQPDDTRAEHFYREALEIFTKCPETCQWNLAWVDYELADTYLRRRDIGSSREFCRRSLELAIPADDGGLMDVLKRRAELDYEIIANCHRVKGDAAWQEGDRRAAVENYKRACFYAYLFQYWPKPADMYTVAFYGEMVARTLAKMSSWFSASPPEALGIADELAAFRGSYREFSGVSPTADHFKNLVNGPLASSGGLRREMLKYAFPSAPEPDQHEFRAASDKEPPAPHELAEAANQELTQIYAELHPMAVR